jgi:hypothetical protein
MLESQRYPGPVLGTSQAADEPNAPQQLGLKLEATKAPANVIIIDRVEKPSENQSTPASITILPHRFESTCP